MSIQRGLALAAFWFLLIGCAKPTAVNPVLASSALLTATPAQCQAMYAQLQTQLAQVSACNQDSDCSLVPDANAVCSMGMDSLNTAKDTAGYLAAENLYFSQCNPNSGLQCMIYITAHTVCLEKHCTFGT